MTSIPADVDSGRLARSTRDPAELYLDLLLRRLTGTLDTEELHVVRPHFGWKSKVWAQVVRPLLDRAHLDVVKRVPVRPEIRDDGRDWPPWAETMVGVKRLSSLRECVTQVIRDGVPGDLLEAGTWRGGSAIYMRAVLEALGDPDRTVWVADSFEGLPPPDAESYPADAGDTWHTWDELAVSLPQVQANFAKYGLLDDRVRFLKGWFRDTLPVAPVERLAVLRLDGDMYESTLDTLRPLYPKVAEGGFVIVDDYGGLSPCKQAVDEYRSDYGITAPLQEIDWTGVLWRKEVGS